jgi:hypothetical protein
VAAQAVFPLAAQGDTGAGLQQPGENGALFALPGVQGIAMVQPSVARSSHGSQGLTFP